MAFLSVSFSFAGVSALSSSHRKKEHALVNEGAARPHRPGRNLECFYSSSFSCLLHVFGLSYGWRRAAVQKPDDTA